MLTFAEHESVSSGPDCGIPKMCWRPGDCWIEEARPGAWMSRALCMVVCEGVGAGRKSVHAIKDQ